MTNQPTNSTDVDNPLYEQVEGLFDLHISSSGADITIKLGGEQITVDYEVFLELRKSIEALISDQVKMARLDELNQIDQAYKWESIVTYSGFKKWQANRIKALSPTNDKESKDE